MRSPYFAGLLGVVLAFPATGSEPIQVVAATNVYGDIAQQIGGAHVAVTSILTHPNQDPHEFEASASTARAMATARLVIYNGADYDPWAVRLLSASGAPSRERIEVAKLVHKEPGDNPHLWYGPAAVSALAGVLAARLTQLDPERAVREMAESGRLSLDGLITHRQDATNAPAAYRTAFGDPSCLKMVLDWRSC